MGISGSRLRTDQPYELLGRAWEYAEQRDDEVDAKIRLEVVVRLAAANGQDRCRCHRLVGRLRRIRRDDGRSGEESVGWRGLRPIDGCSQQRVAVGSNIVYVQRDVLSPARLSEDEAVALMDRYAAA